MKTVWIKDFGTPSFVLRVGFGFAFVVALLILFIRFEGLPRSPVAAENLPYLAIAFILLVAIFVQRSIPDRVSYARFSAFFFSLAFLLTAPFAFMQKAFGFKTVEPILFYLPEISAGDTSALALEFHLRSILSTTLATLTVIVSAWVLSTRVRYFATFLLVAAVAIVLRNPMTSYVLYGQDKDVAHALISPQDDVVPLNILSTPVKKRNLVLYYMEGFERTLAELPFSRHSFARVAEIAGQGIEVAGIRQLHGLNYSAAGLVATQCGVPLIPRGFEPRLWATPTYIVEKGFMPAIECLGNRLAKDGYKTVFVNGSDLSMFGFRSFLQTHGYSDVIELDHFRDRGLDEHMSSWGYDDYALMQMTEEKLSDLAAAPEPFLLGFLTIGTHGPDGVLDATCDTPAPGGANMTIAVSCAVGHLESFLAMLDRSGAAEAPASRC